METKQTLKENIKVRVKPFEKQAIEEAAGKENMNVSSFIRRAVFENSTVPECVLTVRCIMERNKIYNHISFMPINPDIREKILEEVSSLD